MSTLVTTTGNNGGIAEKSLSALTLSLLDRQGGIS